MISGAVRSVPVTVKIHDDDLPDASVAVNGEAMAVDLDRMAIDNQVSLDQREMDVECFRVPGQGRRQIGRSDTRQAVPPAPADVGRAMCGVQRRM